MIANVICRVGAANKYDVICWVPGITPPDGGGGGGGSSGGGGGGGMVGKYPFHQRPRVDEEDEEIFAIMALIASSSYGGGENPNS